MLVNQIRSERHDCMLEHIAEASVLSTSNNSEETAEDEDDEDTYSRQHKSSIKDVDPENH